MNMIIEMIAIGVFLTLFSLVISMAVINNENEGEGGRPFLFLDNENKIKKLEKVLPEIKTAKKLEDILEIFFKNEIIGQETYIRSRVEIKNHDYTENFENIKKYAKEKDAYKVDKEYKKITQYTKS